MVFAFFGSFGVIHAVTKGGPGNATEIMVYKLWKDGFIGLNLGSSAAQSVILMALVIGLTDAAVPLRREEGDVLSDRGAASPRRRARAGRAARGAGARRRRRPGARRWSSTPLLLAASP